MWVSVSFPVLRQEPWLKHQVSRLRGPLHMNSLTREWPGSSSWHMDTPNRDAWRRDRGVKTVLCQGCSALPFNRLLESNSASGFLPHMCPHVWSHLKKPPLWFTPTFSSKPCPDTFLSTWCWVLSAQDTLPPGTTRSHGGLSEGRETSGCPCFL